MALGMETERALTVGRSEHRTTRAAAAAGGDGAILAVGRGGGRRDHERVLALPGRAVDARG